MHPWKPGDLGALLDIDEGVPYVTLKANGRIVEVLTNPFQQTDYEWYVKITPFEQEGHHFDQANVKYIRPIDDGEEYDGNEVSKWEDCPWQPEELVHVETET